MVQDKPTTPAVDSAIRVLQLLVNAPYPLTQREVSAQTGIPAASCYRILNSLLAAGLIANDPGRKRAFGVGARIFQMASTIYGRQAILPFFHPIAEILKNETRHAVLLSSQVGSNVVVVARAALSGVDGFGAHVGQTLPMWRAAAGKAMLSMRPTAYRQQYLAAACAQGELTAEQGAQQEQELQRVMRLGYAVTHGEAGQLSCLAAPVLNLLQEPVAAVSLCIARPQLREEDVRAYSAPLIQAVRQLSARLG
ncbi:IclR family transcriptional regulator [Vogesella sp. LIG4]|uniref:IclR family transcriptional regulator n=1 Tax=Vogesella sp. LIG4 TaxID=1192162 RepID=UPI00081F7A51|nr:IclR family transcriptional regulator [Vogesella sp. LIG4]SCK24776.1 transcriptional regulator, IclR family [Vogesella sp. LIG4]